MITQKSYSNYAEQVDDNLIVKELCNDINEIDSEYEIALRDTLSDSVSDDYIINSCNLPKNIATDTETFLEDRYAVLYDLIDNVHQLYKVDLKNNFTPACNDLGVFWSNELDSYILPVFHFGTPWGMVPECKF